jgi:photosystem II stability/assembly factor-like uncharacterized protein
MKWLILSMLIIANIPLFALNEWKELIEVEGIPVSLICKDSNYLYTVTTQGSPNRLYKSSDSGNNWELICNKFPNAEFSTDMSIPDTMNIFIVCNLNKGIIYKSNDGGKTFELIQLAGVNYFKPTIAMYNKDIGVVGGGSYITFDGWKTYEKFNIDNVHRKYSYTSPIFVNDSILYSLTYVYDITTVKTGVYIQSALLQLNINSKEYELNPITNISALYEICRVNEKLFFACGQSNTFSGGSGHDAIHKSTNGGKTWKRVLDLYADQTKFNTTNNQPPPFGLQSIAFRDSLTGIAVGQFGKIVYTYNGGESWIYEKDLPPDIKKYTPATMIVRFAGSVPIIATFNGDFYRMIEDNLAPKAEDIYSISGKVWEGNKGQPGIPVALGYQVTMTDSNGYYKFTKLAKGSYTVKALNKYFDAGNPKYDYKPFDYAPVQYDLDLSSDTSGIDFNAIDLRTFYSVSGEIITSDGIGLKDIPLTIGDSSTVSIEEGKFIFPRIEQKRTYEMIPYSKSYTFTPWAYSINIDKDLDTFRFVASPITDVKENNTDKEKIVIYPNPASDYIEIIGSIGACSNGNEASPIASEYIQIFDVLGVIQSTPHQFTSPQPSAKGEGVRIDVSTLAPGMYFIKIGNRVEKFVKM